MTGPVAKGAFWSLIDKFCQQGIAFIVFIVVARFLGPVEYGLASFCFVYLLLAIIVLNGLVDGVVSLQLEDAGVLSTLFWLIVLLGAMLSAVSFATAPLVAGLFDEPRLIEVLQLFSIVPLLVALSAVPNIVTTREMNFRLLAMRTIVATVIGGGVGVLLAANGFGVFAIVWQQIVVYVVMNVVIWSFTAWRPGWRFDVSTLAGAVRPGLQLARIYALGWFDQQLPRLLIGKAVGVADLGNFAFVMRIRMALQEVFIVSPIAVLFPGLSRIQGDRAEQQRLAGNMLVTTCLLLFPVLAILAGTAGVYVPLVFGDKWVGAVGLLQIYVVGAASLPFVYTCRELFRANGRLGSYFRINVAVTAAGLLLLGLLMLPDGLRMFAIGIALLWLLSVPVYLARTRVILGVDLSGTLPDGLRLAVAAALALLVSLKLAAYAGLGYPVFLVLFGSIFGGLLSYGLAVLLLLPTAARDAWAGVAALIAHARIRRAKHADL